MRQNMILRLLAVMTVALSMSGAGSAGPTDALPNCPSFNPAKVADPLPIAAAVTPVGGMPRSFSVGADGAARYSLPLKAIPGPGGVTPSLTLDYSSRTGNGYVGVGFSLSGPTAISRCSKTIADDGVAQGVRLDTTDKFCLGSLPLIAVNGVYGANGTEYRTSPETFARITSFRTSSGSSDDGPDYFEVRNKDGLIHTYGVADNDFIGPRRVAWPITETRDRHGNRIKFVYTAIKAPTSDPSLPGDVVVSRRLDEVQYGNFNTVINGVPSPDRKIKFTYENRPDAVSAYSLGEIRTVLVRLAKIEMQRLAGASGGAYVNARSYTLTYRSDGATGYSKLQAVQECGLSASACLPATTFDWQLGEAGFEAGKVQPLPVPRYLSALVTLDVDGNGLDDLAYPDDPSSPEVGGEAWKIVPSGGGAPFNEFSIFTAPLKPSFGASTKAFAIDYDLDGRTDILPRDLLPTSNETWKLLLSRGGGSAPLFMAPINTGFTGPVNQHDGMAMFVDLNGDGYFDVIERREGISVPGSPPNAWYYRLRSGEVSPSIQAPMPASTATDIVAFGPEKLVGQLDTVNRHELLALDLNGDGRDEIVFRHPLHVNLRALNVPQPSHLGGDVDTKLPAWLLNDGVQRVFGDFNGDGLIDLVTNVGTPEQIGQHPGSPFPKVYLWTNKGRGFGPSQIAVSTNLAFDLHNAVVADYNGDGKQDLLIPAPKTMPIIPSAADHDMHLLLSTGSGFTVQLSIGLTFSVPVRIVPPHNDHYQVHPDYFASQGPHVLDADGDGQDDLILIDRHTGEPSPPDRWLFFRHRHVSAPPDRVIGIHEGLDPSPPRIAIKYGPMTGSAQLSFNTPCDTKQFHCALHPHYVVKQVTRDAGLNGPVAATTLISDYFYKTSITHKTSREWLGFAEQFVIQSTSDKSQPHVATRRFYSNTVAKRDPRLLEEWTYGLLPDGRIWLERQIQTWGQKDTSIPTGGSIPYNYIAINTTWSYEFPQGTTTLLALDTMSPADLDKEDGFAQPFRFRRVVNDQILTLDNYGNVIKRRNFFGLGSFQTIIDTTYDVDVGSWLLKRPKKVKTTQILDSDCHVVAECTESFTTEFVEFLRPAGGEPTALPVTVRSYHTGEDPGAVMELTYNYDTYGNITRQAIRGDVDGKGTISTRHSCTTYDPDGVFPHAVTNALGHTTYMRMDQLLGLITVAVDAKGRRSDMQYDTLGRPVKVRTPSGAELFKRYFVESSAGTVLAGIEGSDATGRKAQVLHDRLGRPLIERFKGLDGIMRVTTRDYDAIGTLRRRDSMPVREGSVAPPPITSTYDARGRKLTQTEPNTSDPAHPYVRSWSYDRNTTSYTDTRGNITRTEFDVAGHLGRTVEAVGKPEQLIRNYGYTLFGRLKASEIYGRPETASRYTWDYRGNLLSRNDPDRGLTTYQYNAFNEPLLTRDANGRESRPRYDALGRMVSLQVSEVRPNTTKLLSLTDYTYDVEPLTQHAEPGKLTRIQRADFVSTNVDGDEQRTQVDYAYDELLGRLISITHMLPSDVTSGATENYPIHFQYDTFDRVQAVQYPKLPGQTTPIHVGYQYAASPGNGQLRAITATEQGLTQMIWTLDTTDEANRPMFSTTGDGMSTLQLYDWRGALTSQYLQTGAKDACVTCQRAYANYFYDGEGNLDRRVDLQQGATERFTYDAFNRVTKTSMDSLEQSPQIWTYDGLGNVLTNTHRGLYHYDDPARPMRVTSVTGGKIGTTRTYEYDAVGNQITRPESKVIYNELNLPAQLLESNGQRMAQFLYGPGGERVRKSSKVAGVVTSIGGLYEQQRRGSTIDHHLLVPGMAVLSYRETAGVLTKQPSLFLHTDHLGSPQTLTADDDAGSGLKAVVKETRSYDAFGLKRNPNWLSNSYTDIPPPLTMEGYTGHNDDPELGLIDMKGRVYDPTLARFLTPDPVVASPATTQSWNSYAYGSNNPLRNTDPSGFMECVGCEEFWGAGEAFWTGGTAGLMEYGRGTLERETERFFNRYYQLRRDRDLWKDAKTTQLQKYSEKNIQQTGSTQIPEAIADVDVPSMMMPGLDSGLSPGVDPRTQAICESQPWACTAEEITVIGSQVNDFGRTWCGHGVPCSNEAQVQAEQYAENLGAIEDFSKVYAGMWAAVAGGGLLAEISLTSLEGAAATARAKALVDAAAARAAAAQAQAQAKAAAAAAAVAAGQGTATVYERVGRHASIAVQYGEEILHTHQDVLTHTETAVEMTVREWGGATSAVNQITLQLPNAKAAIEYQRSLIGQSLGPYNVMTNSCVTHCGDVLREGGLDVPRTTGNIVRWLRGQ